MRLNISKGGRPPRAPGGPGGSIAPPGGHARYCSPQDMGPSVGLVPLDAVQYIRGSGVQPELRGLHSGAASPSKRLTAPGIPKRSPIHVLTGPDLAWLPRSDEIGHCPGGMAVNDRHQPGHLLELTHALRLDQFLFYFFSLPSYGEWTWKCRTDTQSCRQPQVPHSATRRARTVLQAQRHGGSSGWRAFTSRPPDIHPSRHSSIQTSRHTLPDIHPSIHSSIDPDIQTSIHPDIHSSRHP